MGKIAGAEQANGNKKFAESRRQCAQTFSEGNVRDWFAFLFLYCKGDQSSGDKSWNERERKQLGIIVVERLQEKEACDRTDDGADGVHHALETKGAAVGFPGDR